MSTIVPPSRPEALVTLARQWLEEHGVTARPALVARRGYYRDSMGEPGKNDLNLYDDAIALVTASGVMTFNANTDPSRQRPGMATLAPGLWRYELGTHNRTKAKHLQYEALIQAAPVVVHRHGQEPPEDRGWFGINIHRGGEHTTGSAGCLTIPPRQWEAFIGAVKLAMQRAGARTIPLLLLAREDVPS